MEWWLIEIHIHGIRSQTICTKTCVSSFLSVFITIVYPKLWRQLTPSLIWKKKYICVQIIIWVIDLAKLNIQTMDTIPEIVFKIYCKSMLNLKCDSYKYTSTAALVPVSALIPVWRLQLSYFMVHPVTSRGHGACKKHLLYNAVGTAICVHSEMDVENMYKWFA